MNVGFELMMKCDMCYDRTSVGKNPMCATVCPSQALHFGTWEEMERLRPRSVPQNTFRFGRQEVRTKVYMMVPRERSAEYLDVASALASVDDAGPAAAVGPEVMENDLMLLNILQ
jgi:Fe-S-cluster-containing dehydrogenase component